MTIDKLAKLIKKGFDDVDAGFVAVDKRFDAQDKKLEQNFLSFKKEMEDVMDQKFFGFKKEMEDVIEEKLFNIGMELKNIRKEIDKLNEKISDVLATEANDIKPVYFDLEKLKKKVAFLAAEIKILKSCRQLKNA
ncbi:hypothetical protein COX27_00470 [Candidatus Kuenenbacteria bacterium CG23_combo_of_CG06-09_8_20_14_all_36_9]|uniref:Uncharacterized protein n=1 Tax=Candidatus Kuenenbacteria bacterium CG10_big_fil_rev_8_21_14_0_10_36_11 TaxID=1974618 RepID=A0A2M6WAH5_9BACT|nr:MAG: hypothetical protein COX27_00470 [Candidatus Kuenenbacteria bacterium CG23_combo_of_CG06-09_8_20_14_all_36_9]PIT89803.1 MAG: hypothetical protein COU23_02030 [Candidatus Kuenenbacteria bacterium CG10_big_fil_rev_8_21_14_0_10_36_11]